MPLRPGMPQQPAQPRTATPPGGGVISGDPIGGIGTQPRARSPGLGGAPSGGIVPPGMGGTSGPAAGGGYDGGGINPGGMYTPGTMQVQGDPMGMGGGMSGTPPWMGRPDFNTMPHQVKKTPNGHVWANQGSPELDAAKMAAFGAEGGKGEYANTAGGMGFSMGGNPANMPGGMGFSFGSGGNPAPEMGAAPSLAGLGGAKPEFVDADPNANRMQLAQLLARRGRM